MPRPRLRLAAQGSPPERGPERTNICTRSSTRPVAVGDKRWTLRNWEIWTGKEWRPC